MVCMQGLGWADQSVGLILTLSGAVLLIILSSSVDGQLCSTRPVHIFNFGDSNSDTGGLAAGLGYSVNPPNGRTFFGSSTGRLSDGRLVIDLLCQSLNVSLLSPYLDSLVGSNFSNGANFAVVGSSTIPKRVPFSSSLYSGPRINKLGQAFRRIKTPTPLYVDGNNYGAWKAKMKLFPWSLDECVWHIVVHPFSEPTKKIEKGDEEKAVLKTREEWTNAKVTHSTNNQKD